MPVVFGKRDNNHDDATTGFKTPRNHRAYGTLSLGGLNGLFGNNPHEDDLSRRLFALVCRAEGLRGRALASISLGILTLFLPASFIFEARFQSLLGAELPRVGITQIPLGTSLYGLLSAWLFRSRESYASRSFPSHALYQRDDRSADAHHLTLQCAAVGQRSTRHRLTTAALLLYLYWTLGPPLRLSLGRLHRCCCGGRIPWRSSLLSRRTLGTRERCRLDRTSKPS